MRPRLSSIRLMEGHSIELTYADGMSGVVDFSDYVGKGVFQRWLEKGHFETVHIGEAGQLEWDDEIDFCPDALYLEISGKTPEDLFKGRTPANA